MRWLKTVPARDKFSAKSPLPHELARSAQHRAAGVGDEPETSNEIFCKMKVKDIIKALKAEGWQEIRQESSHRTFKKDGVEKNVVVNGQESEELSPGVLSKIRRVTGLTLR